MFWYSIFLIVYISVGSSTNLVLLYHCLHQKRDLKMTILLSMAIADLIQSVFGYTLQLVIIEVKSNDLLCSSAAFHMTLLGLVSILHFVMLFVERTIRITSNRSQSQPYDDKRYLIMVGVWLYAFFWALAPLLGWGTYLSEVAIVYSCQVRVLQLGFFDKLYFYGLITFVFGMSVLAIVVLFLLTKIKMKKNLTKLIITCVQPELVDKRRCQMHRFDRMTLTMTLIFFVSWTPFACSALYHLITGQKWSELVTLGAPLMAKSCVLFNPFVYAYYYMNIGPKLFFKLDAKRSSFSASSTGKVGRSATVTTKL